MFGLLLLLALWLALHGADAHADSIPRAAYAYRSQLIREARLVFGLSSHTATFASQVHAESRWVANARNRSGASGLSQIMPRTALGLARIHSELRPAAPLNPQWALRALMRYNLANYRLAGNGALTCSQAKRMLASYNAGPGILKRKVWPRETQRYVARILALEPLYIAANFGSGSCN